LQKINVEAGKKIFIGDFSTNSVRTPTRVQTSSNSSINGNINTKSIHPLMVQCVISFFFKHIYHIFQGETILFQCYDNRCKAHLLSKTPIYLVEVNKRNNFLGIKKQPIETDFQKKKTVIRKIVSPSANTSRYTRKTSTCEYLMDQRETATRIDVLR